MKIHVNLAIAQPTFPPQSHSGSTVLHQALPVHGSISSLLPAGHIQLDGLGGLPHLPSNSQSLQYLYQEIHALIGIPAMTVSLVVIIDKDAYGRVALNSSKPNSTAICYIANDTVKVVTTMGVFGLVFIFNMIMFGLAVRRVVSLHKSKEGSSSSCGL